ncbi:MAG TPA: sugar ABC transporter permease [Ktedonobacteraceae bacterium]|jgi:multiple sugar transport system permease protein
MATPIVHATEQAQRRSGTATRVRWSRYSSRTFYLFVSPWLLGFLALTVIPLVYALLVSFTNFDGISPRWSWIGLDNYVELFRNADTWYSLGRTLLYMCISVPLSIAGGLGLALLLNQRLKAVGFFRSIFYLPSIVPVVASAIMWKLIFDRDAGVLNAFLELFHLSDVTWLIDPTVFYALIIMVLWGLGGGMIISLAGLQGIPQELREAARVDGANAWQAFRRVTLPLLTPVLFFQLITGIIYSLQTFVQPLLLSESNGVGTSAATLVPRSNFFYMVNVYEQFLYFQRFGYGSAMLWVLFVLILVFTLLVFRSSVFWIYYEVDHDE